MILSAYKQQTPEWQAAHLGKVSGRSAESLFGGTKSQDTLLKIILAEHITGYRGGKQHAKNFTSDRLDEGLKAEPEMIRAYEDKYFCDVTHDESYFYHDKYPWLYACSPDGLASVNNGMIEGKAPDSHNHIALCLGLETVSNKYIAQMEYGMWVCNRDYCDFISWCPAVPSYPLFVWRLHMTDERRKEIDRIAYSFAGRVLASMQKLQARSIVVQEECISSIALTA